MDHLKIGHMISADLIKALREVFPLQRPLPSDPERVIWIKSGQQEVIEFLTSQHEETIKQQME